MRTAEIGEQGEDHRQEWSRLPSAGERLSKRRVHEYSGFSNREGRWPLSDSLEKGVQTYTNTSSKKFCRDKPGWGTESRRDSVCFLNVGRTQAYFQTVGKAQKRRKNEERLYLVEEGA